MAAVLVLLASGLAACGDDDSDAGPPEPRPTPTPTASQASESPPSADPTDGVGPRRGALRYADILVFSKDTLTDDMVDRIRGLDGVRSVERLSMAQVSIENRAINLAAVDPATYRNYTPAESAELQEEWDRVAAGQLALVPDLKKRVPGKKGSLRLGSGRDAPTVAIGAYAPQIPQVDAVVNADVGEALGMKPDNALLVATYPRRAPQSVRKPVERIAGDQASVQLLGPDLDISVQQTAYLVGSVGEAVGIFNYTVLPGGRLIAPEPSWVRAHISTRTVPILGQVTCNNAIFPQLEAALARGRRARAGRPDPPRRVRRLLLPAVHRRHHPALQPLLRPGAGPQRARQPARHRRRDGPHRRLDLRVVGLHLGRSLALHRPDALRGQRDRQPRLSLLVGQTCCLMGEVPPIQRQFHRPAGETDSGPAAA